MDARNHGDSPHSPDASYEAMSQDLQGLLLQLGLVPCILIGHSMGGKTAMLLALQRVSYTYLGPCNALLSLKSPIDNAGLFCGQAPETVLEAQRVCLGPALV